MSSVQTPADVAAWMLEELHRVKQLYQETVVYQIKTKFGDDFTYINSNGNLAIDRRVLAEFRKVTGEDVVWERSERLWRRRANYDTSGKRQAD